MFPSSSSRPSRCLKRKSPESDEPDDDSIQPCKVHCKCDCAHSSIQSTNHSAGSSCISSVTFTTNSSTTTTSTTTCSPSRSFASFDWDDEKENTILPPFACLPSNHNNFNTTGSTSSQTLSSSSSSSFSTSSSSSSVSLGVSASSTTVNNTITSLSSFDCSLATTSTNSSTFVANSSTPLVSLPSPSFLRTSSNASTDLSLGLDIPDTISTGELSDALQEQCRLESSLPNQSFAPSAIVSTPSTVSAVSYSNSYSSSPVPDNNYLLRSCLTSGRTLSEQTQPITQHQRHVLFNLSMSKLNKFRCSSEASLLRSVLICNTLRKLERHLDRDTLRITLSNYVSAPPQPAASASDCSLQSSSSTLSESQTNFDLLANSNVNHNNNSLSSLECLSATLDSTSLLADDLLEPQSSTLSEALDETDKFLYLYLDLDSTTSGRLTPFVREPTSQSSSGSTSSSTSSSTTTTSSTNVPIQSSSTFSYTPFTSSSVSSMSSSPSSSSPSERSSLNWTSMLNFSMGDFDSKTSPALINSTVSTSGQSLQSSNSSNFSSEDSSANVCVLAELLSASEATNTLSCSNTPESSVEIDSNTAAATTSSTVTLPSSKSTPVTSSPSMSHLQQLNQLTSGFLNDEIFGDIDLSLYDFDLFTPISPPNVKLSPVSAEELMRSLVDSNSTAVAAGNAFTASLNELFGAGNCSSSSSSSPNASSCITSCALSSPTANNFHNSNSNSTCSNTTTTTSGNGGCGSFAAAAVSASSGAFQSSNANANIPTVIS